MAISERVKFVSQLAAILLAGTSGVRRSGEPTESAVRIAVDMATMIVEDVTEAEKAGALDV